MKIIIASDYLQYASFLRCIPQFFATGEGEVMYQKRNEVRRFEHKGLVFIAKRYKEVNILQKVVYTFFRKSKACRAFLFAQEFRRRDIETPHEVAYIETCNRLGLFSVGYFVSLFAEGAETHLLLRDVQNFSHQLADAVMAQVKRMHSKGVLHGDLNLSNFLCREVNGEYFFSMIDINRTHFTDGMPSEEQCMHNLVRITHRRDLYEYLIKSYAKQRDWEEDTTVAKAIALLNQFEQRKIHF